MHLFSPFISKTKYTICAKDKLKYIEFTKANIKQKQTAGKRAQTTTNS